MQHKFVTLEGYSKNCLDIVLPCIKSNGQYYFSREIATDLINTQDDSGNYFYQFSDTGIYEYFDGEISNHIPAIFIEDKPYFAVGIAWVFIPFEWEFEIYEDLDTTLFWAFETMKERDFNDDLGGLAGLYFSGKAETNTRESVNKCLHFICENCYSSDSPELKF